ncbi:hypothetical protein [Pleionea sp. CnH1-48]|uniref:hypothetical protein n=1 Tax=Pleionea sp. CnH1-48 TaxID=2954494 RepID=UPI00209793EA|nr:hypothetical protein [Pleionea sp. CnH1-48]MCO7223023.1 hypothetical protein [Pleionea sp. CnH1-48]
MENVIRMLDEEQAQALRNEIIEKGVMPYIKAVFERFPKFNSATLLVAQYWDDEADDAVHQEVIFSALNTPNLKSAFETYTDENMEAKDSINSPEDLPSTVVDWGFDDGLERSLWDNWCDNGDAITAFAAFCKEGANQWQDIGEAYSPYAVFRRQGKDVEMVVIGEMIRPWLDGVQPSWQSRYG